MSNVNLRGRRILYVGGRNRTTHVRRVIEEHGARFAYHDGGMEQSIDRLGRMVRQADVVLFPVEYVSHSALHKLKAVCRSLDKPYVPLRHPGLDTLATALSTLSL